MLQLSIMSSACGERRGLDGVEANNPVEDVLQRWPGSRRARRMGSSQCVGLSAQAKADLLKVVIARKQVETGKSRFEEPQGLPVNMIYEQTLRSGSLWQPDGYACGGYSPNPFAGCDPFQQAFSILGARARGVAGRTTRRLSIATSAAAAAMRTTERIGIEYGTGLECTVRPRVFVTKVYVLKPWQLRLWPVAKPVGGTCFSFV